MFLLVGCCSDVEVIYPHPFGLESTEVVANASLAGVSEWLLRLTRCVKQTHNGQTKRRCGLLYADSHMFYTILSVNLPGAYPTPPAIARSLPEPKVMGTSAGVAAGFAVIDKGNENAGDKFAPFGVEQVSSKQNVPTARRANSPSSSLILLW